MIRSKLSRLRWSLQCLIIEITKIVQFHVKFSIKPKFVEWLIGLGRFILIGLQIWKKWHNAICTICIVLGNFVWDFLALCIINHMWWHLSLTLLMYEFMHFETLMEVVVYYACMCKHSILDALGEDHKLYYSNTEFIIP